MDVLDAELVEHGDEDQLALVVPHHGSELWRLLFKFLTVFLSSSFSLLPSQD